MKKRAIIVAISVVVVVAIIVGTFIILNNKKSENLDEKLKQYYAYLNEHNYEAMYEMVILDDNISKDYYLSRNKNIYEGIDAKNIQIGIESIEKGKNAVKIAYNTKMETSAGSIDFDNTAEFIKDEDKEYKINWSSNLIFPELNNEYKVRVGKVPANRGKILDRNGKILAENGEDNRNYPYKEIASHITGYVQGITAEELENMQDKGYTSTSKIGKTGVEKVYDERLRGEEGVKIYIENDAGQEISTLATKEGSAGEDIKLTIDIDLQTKLYEKSKDSEGFFVVMNPKTGEILALVSTPSYDANKFITGMTNEEWDALANNEAKPLYTRFTEKWCPGSTFKPVTAGIGLTSGKLSANDEFHYTGLSWQKNEGWGNYKITTLTGYSGKKNLKNAIIYSDNIYFAQAALKIGEETFMQGLDKIKFNEDIGFELGLAKSQYSNTENITSESILADSGYGQGQILVNPIHMASIYSAFANDGNMIKPYLEYKENKPVEYLVEDAFSKETANIIKEDLIEAVENPNGTGHDVKVNGVTIAGKTGTAELKESKEDNGDTLGWFNCFTTDNNNPLLIVSMAKNKKSTYLKAIIKTLFE